jgi:hypothetical protein
VAKINSINDLPKWFKLKNYDVIRDLSIKELKEQVLCRRMLLLDYPLDELLDIKADWSSDVDDDSENWVRIINGNVILEDYYTNFGSPLDDECLSSSDYIRGFTSTEAFYHSKKLRDKKLIAFQDGENSPVAYHSSILFGDYDLVRKQLLGLDSDQVSIKLDLGGCSDEELINDLRELLPKWRDELKISDPKKRMRKNDSFFRKIKNYRILPLLDLRIWEKINNVTIVQKILTLALYPNGEISEADFKTKVKDTEKKILRDNYKHITPLFPAKE